MTHSDRDVTRFRVLGALEVARGQQQLTISAPMQKVLLVVLLLEAGRPIAVDRLIGLMWPQGEPRTARVTVQNYIRRLRRVLDGGDADPRTSLIATDGVGYRLCVERNSVDFLRFCDLLDRARCAARSHDSHQAAQLYGVALAQWQGEPWPGLDGATWLLAERTRLNGMRATAAEEWAAVELELGRPGHVVDLLSDVVRQLPFRESAHALLVRALHASGRTGDALQRFSHARSILVEELGVEPGPLLAAAQREALSGGEGFPPDFVRTDQVRSSRQTRPAQLPQTLVCFAGRHAELTQLDAMLTQYRSDQRDSVPLIVVTGTAGVGKTTLAVQWAGRVSHRFPNGQLYVNLRGFDPTTKAVDPSDALQGFLIALGIPPQELPRRLEERSALYRSTLADKQIVVLLDNARDAEQVRPLLPAAPGCWTVVTSRSRLLSLAAREGAQQISLGLMTPADSLELLTRRIGRARVASESHEVSQIIDGCAKLPLALALAAARASSRPDVSLRQLAQQLQGVGTLEALRSGEVGDDMNEVFSWSVRTVTPAAAGLFMLLGIFPGPEFGIAAVASLCGVSEREAMSSIEELVRANLLSTKSSDRYACHDLLRSYARTVHDQGDDADSTFTATHRLLDHYLRCATAAVRALYGPGFDVPMDPPISGVVHEEPPDSEAALAWLTAEHSTLLALIKLAGDTNGLDGFAWRLARMLARYFSTSGNLSAMEAAYRAVLTGSASGSSLTARAHGHHGLSWALIHLADAAGAAEHAREALNYFAELGDSTWLARTYTTLASALELQGAYEEAFAHDRQAFSIMEAVDDRAGMAGVLNNMGWRHSLLGEHEIAVRDCCRALALFVDVGNLSAQAATWDSLGHAYVGLGRLEEAADAHTKSARLAGALGEPLRQADALAQLASIRERLGDPDAADDHRRRALGVLASVNLPGAERKRRELRSLVADAS